jgi:hypothetical protein
MSVVVVEEEEEEEEEGWVGLGGTWTGLDWTAKGLGLTMAAIYHRRDQQRAPQEDGCCSVIGERTASTSRRMGEDKEEDETWLGLAGWL